MNPVRMILIGGFLGAGKTTLMAQGGRKLASRGKQVGFITNDQAADLVDTAMLKQTGFEVKEVAGACFCCKFDELILRTSDFSAQRKPDVLMTEPVGSCTDLSATVLQPVKKFYGEKFHVAPFSVVVDPTRLEQLLSGAESVFSHNVMYVYTKQLEEADVIVLNKIDQLSEEKRNALKQALQTRFPSAQVVLLSALNGDGVDQWLDLISKEVSGGRNILEIDYDRYADGEAQLGWLNAAIELNSKEDRDWKAFAFDVLRAFKDSFKQSSAEVAHLKLFLSASGTSIVGNLTSTRGMPFVVVNGTAGLPSNRALMILNARVHLDPAALRKIVEETIAKLSGVTAKFESIESFSPGRPKPTHRFKETATN
jgi:G3E family GTPase